MRADRVPRVALGGILVAGVVCLLVLQGLETDRSAARRVGFVPEDGPEGVTVASVTPGLPGERAGLRVGDRIVAVGGEPLERITGYERMAESFARDRPVTFSIQREGRSFDLRVIPGVPADWGPFSVRAFAVLCYLGIALLALGRDDVRDRLLLGLTMAVALELSLPLETIGHPFLSAAARVGYDLLTGLQIALELHLVSLIPDRPAWLRRRAWVVPVYYGAGLVLGATAGVLSLAEAAGVGTSWNPGRIEALLVDTGLQVWAVVVCGLLAARAVLHPEPRGRQQAGVVLAGALPWLGFVLAKLLLEHLGTEPPGWLSTLEPLALVPYPAAFFAAHHMATVHEAAYENARLFHSVTYEGLTGLLRREVILERLDQELERAARYGRPLSVALADLDHFKRVNDRHGHLAGDALLQRTAQVIAGELRSTDGVGRYGGEEFLLVLPETGLEGAWSVAEKIRRRVQETTVTVEGGAVIRATLSIGLAMLREGESARDLIAAADRALYQAKDGGRDRVWSRVA